MSFASLVKDIKPLPTLNLDLLTKKNKLPTSNWDGWLVHVHFADLLKTSKHVELYVGTVDRLRDDIGSLDRDWYESLATTDMQKISLQSIEMHQDNYRTGKWKRGIIPRPKQIDSQTRLVLQFKVVQQDGTEQIGPPFDVPTGDRVARQRLTNELYEQLRGKRNPIAPKLNFVIEGSSKPEQSNMKVGNSSTSSKATSRLGLAPFWFTRRHTASCHVSGPTSEFPRG